MSMTLLDKLWQRHKVASNHDGTDVLYVDLHLVHEVSSPQAFEGLRSNQRSVRRPDLTLAVMDHIVPTSSREIPISDPVTIAQMDLLKANCAEYEIPLFDIFSPNQGIVHMVAPERGMSRPGMLIVCGDSHTTTHGAFGALAFGIGTSDVEHVLATQCLTIAKPASMLIELNGSLPVGVTSKDVGLALIRRFGSAGGRGTVVELRGAVIDEMDMSARMTLCNMMAEMGARGALIAADDVTFDYVTRRSGGSLEVDSPEAREFWAGLASDADAKHDRREVFDVSAMSPMVTWGTTPAMSVEINDRVPLPEETDDPEFARSALKYMQLSGGEAISDIHVDRVFIGSCTNGRISDLRDAARVVRGRKVAAGVRAMVVPGSNMVKREAEDEGLAEIFVQAGFEWRTPGCSMCLGMNEDVLQPGERCASTSNRNYEGRQGAGGITHLVSPAMAAAAAIVGKFTDPRTLIGVLTS